MTETLHIIPIKDIRDHKERGDCWCHPDYDEDGFYVHHSLDGREKYETKELKLN